MRRRYCWDCIYLEVSEGFYGTDVTPAEGSSLDCLKDHFRTSKALLSRLEIKSCLSSAASCPDFKGETR